MNFKNVSNAVTSKLGRTGLKIKKQSPTLMFGAGVVGVVATVVLASRATLKLEDVLDEHEESVERASQAVGSPLKGGGTYDEGDRNSDVRKQFIVTTGRIVKLYTPAVAVGALSIGALTGAHVTLTKRNASMVAAYAALDQGFREYRDRVLADVGEEKEREYRYGAETYEVYSEKENGEPVVEQAKRVDINTGNSIYARLYGPSNPNYTDTPEHNLFFLKGHMTYLNDLLQTRGHVLLNDAYDALGMERTKEGCVVGWVKGAKGGDGYIDFGIWDSEKMDRFYDFVTGREDSILIDFNVDGIVYDLI